MGMCRASIEQDSDVAIVLLYFKSRLTRIQTLSALLQAQARWRFALSLTDARRANEHNVFFADQCNVNFMGLFYGAFTNTRDIR